MAAFSKPVSPIATGNLHLIIPNEGVTSPIGTPGLYFDAPEFFIAKTIESSIKSAGTVFYDAFEYLIPSPVKFDAKSPTVLTSTVETAIKNLSTITPPVEAATKTPGVLAPHARAIIVKRAQPASKPQAQTTMPANPKLAKPTSVSFKDMETFYWYIGDKEGAAIISRFNPDSELTPRPMLVLAPMENVRGRAIAHEVLEKIYGKRLIHETERKTQKLHLWVPGSNVRLSHTSE